MEQERWLRLLVGEGKSSAEISAIMGKSLVAVKAKRSNLGLSVKDATEEKNFAAASAATFPVDGLLGAVLPNSGPSGESSLDSGVSTVAGACSSEGSGKEANGGLRACEGKLKKPQELPSVEEVLKIMFAAINALNRPGLSWTEIQRLHSIIMGTKIYQDHYAKFVDYAKRV